MECFIGWNIFGEIFVMGVVICGYIRVRKWEDWLVVWYLVFLVFLGEIIGFDLILKIKIVKWNCKLKY